MSDPVKVELVGGTAASNPWHDHRVMLVSRTIMNVILGAANLAQADSPEFAAMRQFYIDWCCAPRVHADDDAIRWLTNRQGDAT